MREALSRLRFRKVRSRAQQAGRRRGARAFRDSEVLHVIAGFAAWGLGLWLVAPAGVLDWRMMLACGVTLVIIGFGGQMLLAVIQPREESARPAWMLMLSMMLLAMADVRLAEWILIRLLRPAAGGAPPLVTPHAFVPLLVAMLYGGQTALVIGLITGVVLALAADFSLGVFLLSLCATAVAALEVPRLRYRAELARALGRIGLWQTPVVLVMAIVAPVAPGLRQVGIQLAALFAWLALSGLLILLILPLAERVTGRTGAISLNAFADLGRPLLQRLSLETPGTYHHCMVVATLAQAAADKIGANGLLARVGAYYHDIGKLGRPAFYMENQMRGGNPHDDLPPNISRMIIVNHVKAGLVLARLHHLPAVITRFIAIHHGTSVIRWFHRKALSQANGGAEGGKPTGVEENHYRYPGPLPTGREETIVALADSVEAASRALAKVTPAHIENLVTAIFNERWSDGQLDRSRLSQAELAAVRQSFIYTLTHLLHARLAYPSHEPPTDTKPAAPLPA